MTMDKEIIDDCIKSFAAAIDALKRELSRVRTGRANPAMLDGIRVDYYGTPTPLAQMANIQVPDARMMVVKAWDKSVLGLIEKAIATADIGISPQNDGEIIRLPIPPLTEERRKEYVKMAKAKGEDARIAVRNIRRDTNEMLKEAELAEDDLRKALERVQAETDKIIAQVDDILGKKEKEILQI
jgi:ribosome recycling factor